LEAKVGGFMVKRDKCTEFFHRVTNSNRRNNSIESLLVNGSVFADQNVIFLAAQDGLP
jgi:hypothetical protein